MGNEALRVEGLSKTYKLGEIGTGTLSHDLNRWWNRLRGREDKDLIIGQENDRSKISESAYVRVINDVSFSLEKGEILGVIGKNGAGKSTLLKLISQITSPTAGTIKIAGRLASLLEVGTGMHPEMTAKENVFLNGSIMGMTRSEIENKFDEIIEFAGCAMYVDTPVKRFSSGMRVRLGFAVAAFLEPEILIVDEVLAVGDAEFQKKAIGKMKEVSKGEGRTVIFVSHNLSSVRLLCHRGIVLDKGNLVYDGLVNGAIEHYQKLDAGSLQRYEALDSKKDIFIKSASLDKGTNQFGSHESIDVSIVVQRNIQLAGVEHLMVRILTEEEVVLTCIERKLDSKKDVYQFSIPSSYLVKGRYKLNMIIYQPAVTQYDHVSECCSFEVLDNIPQFAHLERFNIGKTYNQIELVC